MESTQNQEELLKKLKISPEYFVELDDSLKSDKEFIKNAINKNPMVFDYISEQDKFDNELLQIAAEKAIDKTYNKVIDNKITEKCLAKNMRIVNHWLTVYLDTNREEELAISNRVKSLMNMRHFDYIRSLGKKTTLEFGY